MSVMQKPFSTEFLQELARKYCLTSKQEEVFVALYSNSDKLSAEKIALSLNIAPTTFNTRMTGVYKKFSLNKNGASKYYQLWHFLDSHRKENSPVSKESTVDFNSRFQQVRILIEPQVNSLCGVMNVLGMGKPMPLTGKDGIYTNVNFLGKLTNKQLRFEQSGRFSSSHIEKTTPGLALVKDHQWLMIWGKPGAGKTTFLKYLAMQCITDKLADKVPFFVSLKEFAEDPKIPDLIEYLAKKFLGSIPITIVEELMQNGHALILLDGLDEVREKDTERVTLEIKQAVTKFGQSKFVITCRIAATGYVFERFTSVEVADFDEQQIITFANNWFQAKNNPSKAELFIKQLKLNKPILELASSPLLLTLLCLEFEDSSDFPTSRANLYERSVNILLRTWDTTRGIKRDDLYKKLDVRRREDLLSFIAFHSFLQGELILKKEKVENYICSFLKNLKDIDPDTEKLQKDSEAVLQSIEAGHGLLVERARGVYSFSHLTLHEYFTARKIKLTNQSKDKDDLFETLTRNFANPKWREVFLLTMDISTDVSELLFVIKKEIDVQLAEDQKLQDFLRWVQEKSSSILTSSEPFVVRTLYFSLALDLTDITRKLDPKFDSSTYPDLELDKSIYVILNRAKARASKSLHFRSDLDNVLKLTKNNELRNELQQLYDRLPIYSSTQEELEQWNETDGSQWKKELCYIMDNYRNIGQDLEFSNSQQDLLKKYYNSNFFLWECLNVENIYVERDIREYIVETLLLPVKEIERIQSKRDLIF